MAVVDQLLVFCTVWEFKDFYVFMTSESTKTNSITVMLEVVLVSETSEHLIVTRCRKQEDQELEWPVPLLVELYCMWCIYLYTMVVGDQ